MLVLTFFLPIGIVDCLIAFPIFNEWKYKNLVSKSIVNDTKISDLKLPRYSRPTSYSIIIENGGDSVVAQRWPTPYEESWDERHVNSTRKWEGDKKNHRTKRRGVSEVCYEDVGCFDDSEPFSHLRMPSPLEKVNTRFIVYGSGRTRSDPIEVPARDINDNIYGTIDPDLPTKVIVHGFSSSCNEDWIQKIRFALRTVHECNIVCVDWTNGCRLPHYPQAAANTRLVGRQLAKFIQRLGIALEKVHLIGFSLGAHVAGFAGAELGNVSRITGLDPAGMLFESHDPRARLDETDANFVDVIHTNGEPSEFAGLGSWKPMGHVDFYPNGGGSQTGCSYPFPGHVCSHQRAYKLFIDSISPECRFPAFVCDYDYDTYDDLIRGDCLSCGVNDLDCPWGDMGYYSDKSPARGSFLVITRDKEPFCGHQYQVKVHNSRNNATSSVGKLEMTLIGENSSETFLLTQEDETLVEESVLKKMVTLDSAIGNPVSIEIKYSAYKSYSWRNFFSPSLTSWNIEKVAITNIFGKTLSHCNESLILQSDRSVDLPLYPGECNVSDSNNSTSSSEEDRAPSTDDRSIQTTDEDSPNRSHGTRSNQNQVDVSTEGARDFSSDNETGERGPNITDDDSTTVETLKKIDSNDVDNVAGSSGNWCETFWSSFPHLLVLFVLRFVIYDDMV